MGDIDPRLAGGDGFFPSLLPASTAPEPCKGACDDPSSGKTSKPLVVSERLTISSVHFPILSRAPRSFGPAYPPSANRWCSQGHAWRIDFSLRTSTTAPPGAAEAISSRPSDDRPLSVRNHRTGIVLDHEVTGADEFHAGLFTKLLGENALAQPWVAEDHDWPIEQDDFVLAEDPLPVLVVLVDERSSDPDPH